MTARQLFRWLPRPETILVFMAFVMFAVDFGLEMRGEGEGTGFLKGALSLLAFAFVYRITRFHRQYPLLQYLHILSFFAIPAMLIIQIPHMPYPGEPVVFGLSATERIWMWVLGTLCALGQLAFLFNVIAGIRRGYKSSRHD